jgi:hypothetical protein
MKHGPWFFLQKNKFLGNLIPATFANKPLSFSNTNPQSIPLANFTPRPLGLEFFWQINP